MTSNIGIVLAASLMFIMFGMGLSLTINDFKRVIIFPKAVLLGLISQMVILPLLGYFIAVYLNLSPTIAIGLMLLAVCPGGATSNLLTHLAKGDLALSVSLTAISSVLSIITIPIIVQFALQYFENQNQSITIDSFTMIKQLFVIVIVPVAIGMIVRARNINFALRMEKPVKKASAIIFILVMIGVIFSTRSEFFSYFKEAGLPSILLNVLTMTVGFLLALVFRLTKPQAISISIESGIQNGTLAITLATIALNNIEYSIVPATYGLWMFFTGTLIILMRKRLGVMEKP